jgi:hypothetical protein
MTEVLATLMLVLVIASPSFAQTSAVERTLVGLEDQWALAVRLSDTMALDLIIADDYIGTTATGQIQHKADYLADFTSGDRRVVTLTTEDLDVRVYGHVAVLTHGAPGARGDRYAFRQPDGRSAGCPPSGSDPHEERMLP